VPELSWGELAIRLAVAVGLSGAIGLERELRERAAGLRTHMLVGAGAALFTIVSGYGWADFLGGGAGVTFDPTRIAAQVVTGIGFLGAGAIIRHRLSVRGLTTAAGLWVAAAIGMACGAGYFEGALIATGIVLVGLGPLRWIERQALPRSRSSRVVARVDLRPGASVAPVLDALLALGARTSRVELEDDDDRRRVVQVEADVPAGSSTAVLDRLGALEAVTRVSLDE